MFFAMSNALDWDEEAPPETPAKKVSGGRVSKAAPSVRPLPHSIEAEESLLGSCFIDGHETIPKCISANITPDSFYQRTHGLIFERMVALHAAHRPTDVSVVAESLKAIGRLEEVGNYAFLTQVSAKVPTTAQANYFVDQVAQYALRRELIRHAQAIAEDSYNATDIEGLFESAKFRIGSIRTTDGPRSSGRSPSAFVVPPDGDPSILLGNRFLNRGDGGVLVSTAGMGKSSMSIQSAYCWAIGRDFFGIRPNGPLKSLIVQSEDSDGDVAEAIASMNHGMKLSDSDRALIDRNIVIVTERVRRGARLIEELRRLIKLHKPDLVYLNPLVAFMDGDLTAAKDVGAFLREGLNSLNEPATFGYIIVHHTTKPPTDKGKTERTWNEVMYDMGGSYEIPGWARFVINLKATDKEGEFDLILSKRGSRAGVTRKVPQGAGFREEPTTRIPVKWAEGVIEIEGRKKRMPLVFWEPRDVAIKEAPKDSRPARHDTSLAVYMCILPRGVENAKPANYLHRFTSRVRQINQGAFSDLLIDAAMDGQLGKVADADGVPKYYIP